MTYLYIYILIAVIAWFEIKGLLQTRSKAFQYFVIFIFIFIAGFRYETGVDWAGYTDYYNEISSLDEAFKKDHFKSIFITLDVGYALLNAIVKMFNGGIQTIFFIVSLVSSILLLKNLRRYTEYVITGLLIYYSFYFFIFDMSGLRQGLAIQIAFFAFQFIEQKNFKKYLLYILIATSIHWSAFLLILLYFVSSEKKIKFHYIIFAASLLVFILNIKFIQAVIPNLSTFVKGNVLLASKFDVYTNNQNYSQARSWNLMTIFVVLRVCAIYFLCLINKNINNKKFNFFFNLFIIQVILYFGLYELIEISERLRFYFAISEIIILVMILKEIKKYFYTDILYFFIVSITFINAMPYYLHFKGTIAYHPYQNYIIYKAMGYQSSGVYRLQKHSDFHIQ
nr:EpsG family protein [uncultured Flavobacterium sp.]